MNVEQHTCLWFCFGQWMVQAWPGRFWWWLKHEQLGWNRTAWRLQKACTALLISLLQAENVGSPHAPTILLFPKWFGFQKDISNSRQYRTFLPCPPPHHHPAPRTAENMAYTAPRLWSLPISPGVTVSSSADNVAVALLKQQQPSHGAEL